MENICAIVLAGGKGTRMGDGQPKVLREILGKPIICWVLELLNKININDIYFVVGYKSERIKNVVLRNGFIPVFIKQVRQLGTAHALKKALDVLPSKFNRVVVLFGDDSALYSPQTIRDFIKYHISNKNNASVMVLSSTDALDIGGLVKDDMNRLVRILTKSEIRDSGLQSVDLLCGIFIFERSWIERYIKKIKKNSSGGEYPLPKFIEIAAKNRDFVNAFHLLNENEWNSVNTPEELGIAEYKKKKTLNQTI